MKFSVLICTLDNRVNYLQRLLSFLQPQITDQVEVLIEKDDGSIPIGKKRNILLEKAQGDYISFVDDDDIVSFDYVSKILGALKSEPDCVGMHLLHYNYNVLAGFTYHSISYKSWFEQKDVCTGFMRYYRNPNHLNPVKREYALRVKFPEISMGEDRVYSQNILKYLKTEEYIIEPIYCYLYRAVK